MTLTAAILNFISHCMYEKNLSTKTIKAYQSDLTQGIKFFKDVSQISEVSKVHLKEYLAILSKYKPKTIKRKIASMKALFNYLEFDDVISINPFRKIRIRIKEPIISRPVMDIKEIIKIFRKMYEKKGRLCNHDKAQYKEHIRNIAIIELLFNTGARVSEIANLKEKDFDIKSGVMNITGKGSRERTIQICNKESISAVNEYYALYKEYIANSKGWFFINRLNGKLSDQSIRNMVCKVAKEAGITKKITPHVFRHTFATLLLEKNVDLKYIQSFLGHSSITTTQIYTHATKKRQRQILTSKHPRQDFSFFSESF